MTYNWRKHIKRNWTTAAAPPPSGVYRKRDALLLAMGFKSYESYLQSPKWRAIRQRVLMRDNDRCQRCNCKANQVHHRSYSQAVLDGKNDSELASLCSLCHHDIEYEVTTRRKKGKIVTITKKRSGDEVQQRDRQYGIMVPWPTKSNPAAPVERTPAPRSVTTRRQRRAKEEYDRLSPLPATEKQKKLILDMHDRYQWAMNNSRLETLTRGEWDLWFKELTTTAKQLATQSREESNLNVEYTSIVN